MENHDFRTNEPLWPTTLCLPARPPKLVYLDVKDWIALSKAHSGHSDGKHSVPILDACLRAVNLGIAVFPLSEYIYSEISKIKNHRQRRDLRKVIDQVCQYKVLASLTDVERHEIEAVLDLVVGPNPVPLDSLNYLGWGVNEAFGRAGDVRLKLPDGEDVTDQIRDAHPIGPEAFDAVILGAQIGLNRKVIEGPTAQDEPEMRADGWNPESVVHVYERQTSEEIAQVRRFDDDPRWRRGRIRDVIITRELIFGIGDTLIDSFENRGTTAWDRFWVSDGDDLRSYVNAMPSLDVIVTLKTSLHRNPNHQWKNNDIFDIWTLALTIPYCDIVVTDSSMHSHVTRNNLDARYDTIVISSLSDLLEHIE